MGSPHDQGQERRPAGVLTTCGSFPSHTRVRPSLASQGPGMTLPGAAAQGTGHQLSLAPTQSLLDSVQVQAGSRWDGGSAQLQVVCTVPAGLSGRSQAPAQMVIPGIPSSPKSLVLRGKHRPTHTAGRASSEPSIRPEELCLQEDMARTQPREDMKVA